MTEAEWLVSKDPDAMGAVVLPRKRASARVMRLYVAAFWGWQSRRLKKSADRERLQRRAAAVGEWAETNTEPQAARAERVFVGFLASARDGFQRTYRAPGQWGSSGAPAREFAAGLLREVFGNPFATRRARKTDPRRGRMFDAGWRTDTVLSLANQMYDSGEFGAMAILADALQDAGCDNDDILSHCRDAKQAHVRGCWVCDLILEKQ